MRLRVSQSPVTLLESSQGLKRWHRYHTWTLQSAALAVPSDIKLFQLGLQSQSYQQGHGPTKSSSNPPLAYQCSSIAHPPPSCSTFVSRIRDLRIPFGNSFGRACMIIVKETSRSLHVPQEDCIISNSIACYWGSQCLHLQTYKDGYVLGCHQEDLGSLEGKVRAARACCGAACMLATGCSASSSAGMFCPWIESP